MNVKILKFLVIFMGILIVLGFIVLAIGIYQQINYIGSNNTSKDNFLVSLEKPPKMKLQSKSIVGNRIILNYENNEKMKIIIFDFIDEIIIKEIDLLK